MSGAYVLANALLFACSAVFVYAASGRRRRTARLLFSAEYGIWVYFFLVIVFFMALGALPERLGFPEARLLRKNVVTAAFAAVGIVGLILMRRSASRLAADAREASASFRRLARSRLAVLSLLMIILLLGTGLSKAVRYTPHVFDVLSYHLEPVARWHQEGRMPVTLEAAQWHQDAWKPITNTYEGSPVFENVNRELLGGSILNLWAFWLFDNIVIIALPAVIFSAALCLALYRMMRFLAIRAPLALFFTAAIASTPAVLIHMDTCKNYTSYIYPWVSLTFLLAESVSAVDRRSLILGAFPFAIAWSSKIVSTFVLPLTLGVFLAAYLVAHRRLTKGDALFAVAFATACLALATSASWFWVYRNYANDGTYFMRIKEQSWAFSISGMENEFDNMPFRDRFEGLPFAKNARIFLGNVASYPSRIQDPPVRGDTYEVDGKFASNFGLIYFSFGQVFLLLYLVLFARRALKPHRAALFFLAAAAFMALMAHWPVYFNPYSYRSHLFWPLMTLPISLYALRVMTAGRIRALCMALITVAVFFHWATTLHDASRTTDQRRIITDNLPLMNRPIAQYWHAGAVDTGALTFGDDVRLACFATKNDFLFSLYDTAFRRRIVPLNDEAARDRQYFWRLVADEKIDIVYSQDGSFVEDIPRRIARIPGTKTFFRVSREEPPGLTATSGK